VYTQEISNAISQATMPRRPRPVPFRCEFCGEDVTEDRMPGPTPKYCRRCEVDAHRSIVRQRVEAYRRRQDEARGSARGSVGRPRKG
jgi:hypothetical protein